MICADAISFESLRDDPGERPGENRGLFPNLYKSTTYSAQGMPGYIWKARQ
jgi:hypothetical protein